MELLSLEKLVTSSIDVIGIAVTVMASICAL